MNKVIEKAIEESNLGYLLGVEGVNELRSKLIDMLVETVIEQLENSSEWIISPDAIYEHLFEDIYEEIKDEYIANAKGKIMAQLDAKFGV